MSSFKNADAGVIVDQLIKTIQKERDYLSEIDGKIGDGDHGINMNKGFTMCEKKLEGTTYNLSEGLTTLGETLLEDIGGSMGPLYGMLFDEMAQACEDEEEITADVFAEMITASVEGIQDISPAQVGDKSLLDTLIPAKEAFVEAKEAGKDFAECLDAMNAAAEKGWQSTKDADIVYPKSWAPFAAMEKRTDLYAEGDQAGIDALEKELLAQNAEHKDWCCTEELMSTTKDGKALYLHCLPADINGVSCKDGEVEASVFDRYRDPLYKEASYKPYIIAAMILLAKQQCPQETLAKLAEKATERHMA